MQHNHNYFPENYNSNRDVYTRYTVYVKMKQNIPFLLPSRESFRKKNTGHNLNPGTRKQILMWSLASDRDRKIHTMTSFHKKRENLF